MKKTNSSQSMIKKVCDFLSLGERCQIYGMINSKNSNEFSVIQISGSSFIIEIMCDTDTDDLIFNLDEQKCKFDEKKELILDQPISWAWFCRNTQGYLDILMIADSFLFPCLYIYALGSSLRVQKILQ